MIQLIVVLGGVICFLALAASGRWLLGATLSLACFAAAAVHQIEGRSEPAVAVFGLVVVLGLLSMSVRELLERLGEPRRRRSAERARRARMAERRKSDRAAA